MSVRQQGSIHESLKPHASRSHLNVPGRVSFLLLADSSPGFLAGFS